MNVRNPVGLLARESGLRSLWVARSISVSGDAMTTVALVVLVALELGEGTAVAALLLAEVLPRVASPLAGALADRCERRALLVGSEVGQAVLAASIAWLLPPLPLLLLLVALRGALATVAQPAGRAAVPHLVEDEDLPAANGVLGLGVHGGHVAGPAVAGLLLPVLGTAGVVAVDAMTSVIAVGVLLGLPRLPAHRSMDPVREEVGGSPSITNPAGGTSRVRELIGETREGLRALRQLPTAAAVAAALAVLVVFTGMANVALPFLARDVLMLDERGIALLFAAGPTGWLLGALMYSVAGHRTTTRRWWLVGLALHPLALIAVALTAGLGDRGVVVGLVVLVAAMLVAAGLGNGMEVPAGDTLLQRVVPQRMLGRVMAVVYGAAFVAGGIAFAVGGLLVDVAGPTATYLIAGTGGSSSVPIGWLLLRRSAHPPPLPDP